MAGAAAEAVEDDEDITPAQAIEAGGQVRAIACGAGGMIFEHALTAGGVQRVELAAEDLATFGGRDACVAMRLMVCVIPKSPLRAHHIEKKIVPELS